MMSISGLFVITVEKENQQVFLSEPSPSNLGCLQFLDESLTGFSTYPKHRGPPRVGTIWE